MPLSRFDGPRCGDSTACRPALDMAHLEAYLLALLQDTESYLGYLGCAKGDAPSFIGMRHGSLSRPLEQAVAPPPR